MTDLFSKIKEVTELPAISGHEAPVRDYLRKQITPHVDEVVTDGLGSIFGVRHSEVADAPRIMVAGHMDEVGFMIRRHLPRGGNRWLEPYGGQQPTFHPFDPRWPFLPCHFWICSSAFDTGRKRSCPSSNRGYCL